jgi:hypothetical protein
MPGRLGWGVADDDACGMSTRTGPKGRSFYTYTTVWSAHRWSVVEASAVVRGPARDREPCGQEHEPGDELGRKISRGGVR